MWLRRRYYLDLTMSTMTHRFAMSKLARVQCVSHGHPLTSGIPSHVMNYYISWGAAELPTADDHYTETLALLAADQMHQYYDPRIDADGKSVISGEPFDGIGR
jgi:predicted O-linked N-acetylglucosamine transferase (SPINDLY family)